MALVSLTCPRCGAALGSFDARDEVTCRYCNTRIARRAEVVAPPPRPSAYVEPVRTIPVGPQRVPPTHVPVALRAMIGVVAVALVGGLVALAARPRTPTSREESVPGAQLAAGEPRFRYWDGAGPIAPTTVAGKEAFVVGRRIVQPDELRVAAVDAATGEAAWITGDLGSYMQAYQAVRVTTLGAFVVMTDADRKIHALDRETGKVLRTASLPDRASKLCVVGGGQVVVVTADRASSTFDPAAGVLKPMAKGASPPGGPCVGESRFARHEVKLPGAQATHVATDGVLRVAGGYKAPGTAVPIAFGLDASDNVLWQTPLYGGPDRDLDERSNDFGAVGQGRYLTHYKRRVQNRDDEHRLVLFDARTGGRFWDVPLEGIFAVDRLADVAIGAAYVYVGRMGSVETRSLATGALVSVFGVEKYDRDMER